MGAVEALIRPSDAVIEGPTLTYAPYDSAEANRRLIDLCFRDAHTAIDLTYGAGRFWAAPFPPDLTVYTNSLDPLGVTAYHRDFTRTGFEGDAFDLAIYDPPHLADAGASGLMAEKYGTAKGIDGLYDLVRNGAREAWRIARVGILCKLADTSHGGELLRLSDWVAGVIPVNPYAVLHTYRPVPLVDPKWRVQRAPRANGAVWMAFRKDGHMHKDFRRLYERQERLRAAA